MDRAQGRVAGQLAGRRSGTKALNGRGCRARQPDGPHHMGHDDEGAELQNGVTRFLFREACGDAWGGKPR